MSRYQARQEQGRESNLCFRRNAARTPIADALQRVAGFFCNCGHAAIAINEVGIRVTCNVFHADIKHHV